MRYFTKITYLYNIFIVSSPFSAYSWRWHLVKTNVTFTALPFYLWYTNEVNLKKSERMKAYLNSFKESWDITLTLSDVWIDLLTSALPLTTKKEMSARMKQTGLALEPSVYSLLYESLELHDLPKQTQIAFTKRIQQSFKPISTSMYLDNPYMKMVKPKATTEGSWTLCYTTYTPFQPFLYGDISFKDSPTFEEITPIGFDTQSFSYLEIKHNDSTWMSVTPFEIETMKAPLAILEGHVVTLGLGLGYIAFMVSLKPNVKSVTIVEKDERVISLFKDNILPFFPHPEKITIVHQDAFDYLKRPQPNIDHLFVDIYQTADDGLPLYLQIKGYESLWTNTTFSYWLEQSILGKYRRYMMFYLFELDRTNNQIDLSNDNKDVQDFLTQLHVLTKDTVLNTPEDVNQWLSSTSLMSLLSKQINYVKSVEGNRKV